MVMTLITLALAMAAVAAFRVGHSPLYAWLPRQYAFVLTTVLALIAGAASAAQEPLTIEAWSVVALLGLCGLFLAYPAIQARRKRQVKASVMLALAASLVFGAYLQLSRSSEHVRQVTVPATQSVAR